MIRCSSDFANGLHVSVEFVAYFLEYYGIHCHNTVTSSQKLIILLILVGFAPFSQLRK